MAEPKHDPTPLDEIDAAIRENIERGLVIEASPGRYSLTPAGIKYVENMLRRKDA